MSAGTPTRWARLARILLAVELTFLIGYLGALAAGGQVVGPAVRDGLELPILVLLATVTAVRGLHTPGDRSWSWAFAAGQLASLFARLVDAALGGDAAAFPSVADWLYMATYPLVIGGLVLFVRREAPGLQRSVLLDGLVAGLGSATLACAVVLAPLLAAAHGSWTQKAVVVTYPVVDAIIAGMVVGILVVRGGWPGFYGWIAAGWLTVGIADVIFVFQVVNGTFRLGTGLDAVWAIGLNLVAIGVWLPRRVAPRERVGSAATLAAALGAGALALAVLVRAAFTPTPPVVVVFAVATLLAAAGRIVVGFLAVRDLSLVRQEARTDELTGLGNRRRLYEAIEHRLARLTEAERLHLVLVDLDRFKEVNDSLGHSAGDEVLMIVGERLAACLRGEDVLARLGGDEYAVLLGPQPPAVDPAAAVRRMVAEVAAPMTVAGLVLHVGASAGIATAPIDSVDRTELMRQADVAMYNAKQAGGGVAAYDPDRDGNTPERLRLVGDLRTALIDEPGQIVVHYQPKCRPDGSVVGAEALVRWRHPTRGLVYPDGFIDLAESNLLMGELTRLVLRDALARVRRWRTWYEHATVAVNLSVSSLQNDAFVDEVLAELDRAGVPAAALILEITEPVLMSDPQRCRQTLDELNWRGVRLAVDDYGTGHCSLAYLRNLSVHELKLDRSFVRDIATEARDAAIVRSTIELAHSLGMVMVAEGVEDGAAAGLLREMGCDLVQGYHFGRPGPAEQLDAAFGAVADPAEPAA